MPKKAANANPFTGRWRIVSMSAWDQEFIDEEEEGYFEFDQKDALVMCLAPIWEPLG
ncbi:MAG: hypothetical protein ACOYKN_00970 [Pirellula sp.]